MKMKKIIPILIMFLVISSFVFPPKAQAAWWNPKNWFSGYSVKKDANVNNNAKKEKINFQENSSSNIANDTSSNSLSSFNSFNVESKLEEKKEKIKPEIQTKEIKDKIESLIQKPLSRQIMDQSIEIEKLKTEIENLKKQVTTSNVSQPKSSVTPAYENNQIQFKEQTITPIETWEQQEARDFAYADAMGWTSLISTNTLGEKRYYRKEDNQWVRKNSEAETQRQNPINPMTGKPCLDSTCSLDLELELLKSQINKPFTLPNFQPPPAIIPVIPDSFDQYWKEKNRNDLDRNLCQRTGGFFVGGGCI